MTTNHKNQHFVTPYSKVIKWNPPPDTGFLTLPRAGAIGQGWGSPFKDPEGNPIEPGTEGSTTQNNWLFGEYVVDEEGTKEHKTVNLGALQLVGEIDWRSIDDGTRFSWHGPRLRYFPDPEFDYEDGENSKIYQDGQLIAVAPKPVLGAAQANFTLAPVLVAQDWLVVVCKDGTSDKIYARPWSAVTKYSEAQITPELLVQLKRINSPSVPDGWRQIGMFQTATVGEPFTPWFFDGFGTEARCMRTIETQSTGDYIADYQDLVQLRMTISSLGAVTITQVSVNSTKGFDHSEQRWIKRNNDYVETPTTEIWENYKLQSEIKITGDMIIGVDWKNDGAGDGEWVEAVIDCYLYRFIHTEWTVGVGTANDYRTAVTFADKLAFSEGPPNPGPVAEDSIWPFSTLNMFGDIHLGTTELQYQDDHIVLYNDASGGASLWYADEQLAGDNFYFMTGWWWRLLQSIDLRNWHQWGLYEHQQAQLFLGLGFRPDAPPGPDPNEWQSNITQDVYVQSYWWNANQTIYLTDPKWRRGQAGITDHHSKEYGDTTTGDFNSPNWPGNGDVYFDDYQAVLESQFWADGVERMLVWMDAEAPTEGYTNTVLETWNAPDIDWVDTGTTMIGEPQTYASFKAREWENGGSYDDTRLIKRNKWPRLSEIFHPPLLEDDGVTETELGQNLRDWQFPRDSGFATHRNGYVMYSLVFTDTSGNEIVANKITNGVTEFDPAALFGHGADRFGPIYRL